MPLLPGRILTFLFVLIVWVPFRASNWAQAKAVWRGMFAPVSWKWPGMSVEDILLFAAGAVIIFCFKPVCVLLENFRPAWRNAVVTAALTIISMFFFVKYSPFIYFNF
jgi:hypothetical protein